MFSIMGLVFFLILFLKALSNCGFSLVIPAERINAHSGGNGEIGEVGNV